MEDSQSSERKEHWQENDSQKFIDYGRYFVPEREFQTETLAGLINPWPTPFHVLELACGEALLAQAILDARPNSRVHAYDASPMMLERAQTRLAPYGDRFEAKPFQLEATNWRKPAFPVSAVVSSLAIHHLDNDEKQQLFQDVQQFLLPTGQFIIADLVLPAGLAACNLAANQWDELVRQRAQEIDGNTDAFEVFEREQWNFFRNTGDPLDNPAPLFDQLIWLEQAGFVEVDVYWMKAGHAIFGGRKSE